MYNTEYRKCVGNTSASQVDADEKEEADQKNENGEDHKLSEDDLVEMMEFTDVRTCNFHCRVYHHLSLHYFLLFYFTGKDITESLQTIFRQKCFTHVQS